jgi:hypothetical protein
MANTGHSTASSWICATLSITSVSVIRGVKIAVATALPNTSCAQLTEAEGVIVRLLEIRRSSRLSRGRSISRCGQRLTSRLKRYVVL